MVIRVIQIMFIVMMIIFFIRQIRDFRKNNEHSGPKKNALFQAIGFVVNFFDALGIGDFAPSLAIYHLTKTVDDRKIPGVMNVGVAIPVMVEGLLFMSAVKIDVLTLVSVLVTSFIGAMVGVRTNERINVRAIQKIMGIGLLVAAFLLLGSIKGFLPSGGTATGVTGIKLVIINVVGFILGLLLPLGVGHYAPMMVTVYLCGMAPLSAFPIMMTMGGTVCFQTGQRFLKNGLFNREAALGQTIGGSIGVVIAVYLVKSMPLEVLNWLVLIVVVYSAITMIHSGFKKQDQPEQIAEEAVQQE
jgi:uncharacterized membrane protein YfcA